MADTLTFLNLAVPIDSLRSGNANTQPQTAQSGILGESVGDVRQLSTSPEQNTLQATLTGTAAESLARELEELAASAVLDSIPVVDSRTGSRRDGYYATTLVSANPAERMAKEAFQVELRLEKRGTRNTHWRQTTTDVAQLTHDFGSTAEAHLGIPATATKVRWCNDVSNDVQALPSSDVIATRTGEHGDVDIVDANDAPVSNPSVIYELDYTEESKADPGVWDSEGNTSKTDADDNVLWSHVYATQHEFDGKPVLDNGLLRITFDESAGSITAEEYTSGSWSAISLTSGDWTLFDVDIVEIGQAQVVAYLEFENTTDGSMFALEARMETGAQDLLWNIPADETGPIPNDLQTWLDPIASSRNLTANPERTVKARSEVAKR